MMNFHKKLGIKLKINHLWAENKFDENHRNFNRNEFRPLNYAILFIIRIFRMKTTQMNLILIK